MPPTATARDLLDTSTAVLDALPFLAYRDRHHTVPTAGPAPGRYLALTDGAEHVLLPLLEDVTQLGRGFGRGVMLDDQSVSRRHAVIAVDGDAVRLLDDRSANGTYVNGRRIDAVLLRDGDVLMLGRVVLTYREVPRAVRRADRRTTARRRPA
jgi:pSer/pThr/pTyr-binding forkhead associated (FHA) protein